MNTARDRLEAAFARIDDPAGEGSRTFIKVNKDSARAMADASDARRAQGQTLGPLDGRIVSIKDCIDVQGERTQAAAKSMRDQPLATEDAPVVARLRRAGAILIGRTNMSEFAFTGLGLNPHFGNPGNPADRSRCPGGSSSGAAVSVADGMAEIGLGTDTGGSVRTPAAFCGLVGYKPTKARVPTDAVFPLSFALDSIGPLAKSVADCAATDAVLAGIEPWHIEAPIPGSIRLAVAKGPALGDLEPAVEAAFAAGLKKIAAAGVSLGDLDLTPVDHMRRAGALGGLVPAESHFIHRDRMKERADEYDPVVRARIKIGAAMSGADVIGVQRIFEDGLKAMDAALQGFDGVLMPTTPIVAPKIAAVSVSVEAFLAENGKALRNTYLGNFHGLCAISLPLPVSGLPVGLMILARANTDKRLLALSATIERILRA
jgi:aspartyl-tRNA(Asn)/glutamyl-tRNA(Gln) amidotransferase subunit A